MENKNLQFNEKELDNLASKYQLNYLVLFGSRSDGSFKTDSDCDIAISSKRELDFFSEFELSEKLSSVFKIKVDLVNVSKAGPVLMKEITDNGKLIKEYTQDSYDRFEIFSFMNYVEAKPLLRMKEEYIERNVG